MMKSPPVRPNTSETRRYDIDWLRVLAVLLIFLYHSSRPFDNLESWHVKNNQLTSAFTLPAMLGALWIMPLFFVLSGASAYFSLRSRAAESFVRARFLRLAVPLVTIGWFVLSPPQIYIERVTNTGYNTPPFSGSFLEFLPQYFHGIYGAGGNFAWHGVHLWFLYWLYMFSLLALPIFLYLMNTPGRRLIAMLAALVERPGAIFLFALPLCLSEAMIRAGIGPDHEEGGWFLATYVILLIYGFLIVADARYDQAIQKHRWAALGLAALAVAVVLVGGLPSEWAQLGAAAPIVESVLKGVAGWFFLVAILGFGGRHLRAVHPSLRYAGEAVLPFYILHQPVIVMLGYVIRTWDMSIGVKYMIVSIIAFTVIMLVYEFAVRRFNLLRILFGMHPQATRQPAAQPAALG
jgi:peptidoglycan/LPS O-acetylase OafA/YrhL